jgi:pilus assembly protein CpaF
VKTSLRHRAKAEIVKNSKPQFDAVVIGAGGAARAVLFALAQADVGEVVLVARNTLKAAGLLAHFGLKGKVIGFDTRLPDGSRLHVVIPEITAAHWAVNIRKHLMKNLSINDLVGRSVMSQEIGTALVLSVQAGLNILVCGGTQAGKTTVLNALASAVPRSERVITIEEVFELTPQLPDVIQMQTRSPNLQGEGEIPLRRLIKESLRMRPTRIIVGEVREAEALDLLIALNSGLPGMGTLHANSPRDAIIKLQTLPLLAGENISHKFIAPTVASAIDLIVHVTLDASGTRRINEVAAVTGRFENDRAEIEMLWKWDGHQYLRGVGSLPHPEKFETIGSPLPTWWHV